MACALTSGYSATGCATGIGGIKRLLITEYDNLDQTNAAKYATTAGVITTLVLATGKLFREWKFDKEMGKFTDPKKKNVEGGTISVRPTIEATIKNPTTTVRNELDLVQQNVTLVIVESKSGVFWMFGLDGGMDLIDNDFDSGQKIDDPYAIKLMFTGASGSRALEVNSSLIAAQLVAAS